ncbi:hypothetical protein ACQKND_22340 [Viridibacillus arvi]|uniref:hypothetical protein n=1 Tax=Viridibacillus arvi TaxID=263475 RepID=UPI003CFE683D
MNCTPIVRQSLTIWRCSFYIPKFTVEDKLGAVNRYQLGIESINSIAKSVGTARSNLLNWVKQYETMELRRL